MIHSIFRGFRLAIDRIILVRMNGKSSLLYLMREAVRDTTSGLKEIKRYNISIQEHIEMSTSAGGKGDNDMTVEGVGLCEARG